MCAYLSEHISTPEARDLIARLSEEYAADVRRRLAPPAPEAGTREFQLRWAEAYVLWLMDRDRKSTTLKSLQGKVWESGYRNGEIRGRVFDDVPSSLRRWRDQNRPVYIFSSGSVLAQKLLFSYSTGGDLSPLIAGYFDTLTGSKTDPDSYRRTASAMGLLPSNIIFVSDVVGELDATGAVGMQTRLGVNRAEATR